jgi:hypothetical protein
MASLRVRAKNIFIFLFTFRRSLQIQNQSHNSTKSVQGICHNTTSKNNHYGVITLFKYFNNFNISNIDKEINKKLPEDVLIEDRNMLE